MTLRTPRWKWFCVQLLLVPVVILLTQPAAVRADGRQTLTDEVFLEQLTERSLFQSALNYCSDRRSLATTADDKALWQLRWARVSEQQTWITAPESRDEVLNQILTDLFEFAATHQISAEWELRLRLQQAAVIRTSVRIAVRLNEAGHLSSGQSFSIRPQLPIAAEDPARPNVTHAQGIDDAIQLLSTSSQQLETIRPHIDAKIARELREHSRLLLAELHLLTALPAVTVDSAKRDRHREQATDLLRQVQRTARESVVRHQCEHLSAELALMPRSNQRPTEVDSPEFAAHIRQLSALQSSDSRSMPEMLSVRLALRQRDSTLASQLLDTAEPASALQRQEQSWLRLECRLGRFELADQLEDADLKRDAEQAFRTAQAKAIAVTSGVHAEAVNRVVARFELVAAVGAAVANQIQEVESLRTLGRTADALQRLDATLLNLPVESADRSRAALQLQAGELLIDLQHWENAETRLARAAESFLAISRSPEAATADLLRIFAMSQQLRNHATRSDVNRYMAALQYHIRHYSDESTVPAAREWLFQALHTRSPFDAFDVAAEMFDQATERNKRLMHLDRMASMLTASIDRPPNEDRVTRFRHALSQLRSESSFLDATFAKLELSLLFLDVRSQDERNWSDIQGRLTEIQSMLTPDSDGDSHHHTQLMLLQAVVAARVRTPTADRQTVREAIINLPQHRHSEAVDVLYQHYAKSKLQAGNQWLAQLSDALLRPLVLQSQSVDQQLKWLQISARNSQLTENSDVMNEVTQRLLAQQLTTKQIAAVASVITEFSSRHTEAVRTTFWRNLLKTSDQGSDHWLEASLRLAEISAAAGATDTALRQLGVITAIYPSWGDASRLKRVRTLLDTLGQERSGASHP